MRSKIMFFSFQNKTEKAIKWVASLLLWSEFIKKYDHLKIDTWERGAKMAEE